MRLLGEPPDGSTINIFLDESLQYYVSNTLPAFPRAKTRKTRIIQRSNSSNSGIPHDPIH
jgi:hypothetical protein